MTFFDTEILGNTVSDYSVALGITLAAFLIFVAIKKIVLARFKEFAASTKNKIDDFVADLLDAVYPFLYLIMSIYVGSLFIIIQEPFRQYFNYFCIVLILVYVMRLTNRVVNFAAANMLERKKVKNEALAKFLTQLVNISLWLILGIMVLSNLGVNVTSLVAGLGIGGLAVGLALQDVLSDLFSGVSILLDKPFAIGDYVMIGSDDGIVKKIGIKTTRITTLQGEELIFSNKHIAASKISNFKRMKRRRMTINIGVEYSTPVKKLEKISSWIEEIIKKQELAEFDRCYFTEMADFSLVFEIVFYTNSNVYAEALAVKHEINLDILRTFEQEKVAVAFPTQTVHVRK